MITKEVSSTMNTIMSYANTTKKSPKINNFQGLIIENKIGAEIEICLSALKKIVPPSKILAADSIPNGRILVFLDSKQTVDDLIDSKQHLVISQQIVYIRPYITRKMRITFSHVLPQVNNEALEDELRENKIILKSPITILKGRSKDPDLAHIDSFKRQAFVEIEDVDKLPDYITTLVEGNEVIVYISLESPACFHCRKTGHLARNCSSKATTVDASVNRHLTPQKSRSPLKDSPRTRSSIRPSPIPHSTVINPDLPAESHKVTILPLKVKKLNNPGPSPAPAGGVASPIPPLETGSLEICNNSNNNYDYLKEDTTALTPKDLQDLNWDKSKEMMEGKPEDYPTDFSEFQKCLTSASCFEMFLAWKLSISKYSIDPTSVETKAKNFTRGLQDILSVLPSQKMRNRAFFLLQKLIEYTRPENDSSDTNDSSDEND